MSIEIVKQERVGECGAACLAMVLGKSLEEVVESFPDCHERGITEPEMIDYLMQHGVPALASTDWPTMDISAIVTVPSLNHVGLLHFIVWDAAEKRYLDPSNEELQFPDDSPEVYGQARICWASVILLWRKEDFDAKAEA